jgi:hypothetical protein
MRNLCVGLVLAALFTAALPTTSEAGILFHRRCNDCCNYNYGCCNPCNTCNSCVTCGCNSCGYAYNCGCYRGCTTCGYTYRNCGCGYYVYTPSCGCGYTYVGWQYVVPSSNVAPAAYAAPAQPGVTSNNAQPMPSGN